MFTRLDGYCSTRKAPAAHAIAWFNWILFFYVEARHLGIEMTMCSRHFREPISIFISIVLLNSAKINNNNKYDIRQHSTFAIVFSVKLKFVCAQVSEQTR